MLNRNVLILAIAYSLGFAGAPMLVLVGGIAGARLAPTPAWATAPLAAFVVGVAVAAVPGPLAMARIGRKRGFLLGAALGAAAALVGAWALEAGSFALLCVASIMLGGATAIAAQYRFAAAESVPPAVVGRAVSFVLLGGVAAALIGPEIARRTQDWPGRAEYAASFLALAAVYVVVFALLLLFNDVAPRGDQGDGPARPLRAIATQPLFRLAVLAGTAAFGAMSFVMTATPVSMHVVDGHSVGATAFVIQSHIVAMYLPSLVTGPLIATVGLGTVMRTGALLMGSGLIVAGAGHGVAHYWLALVLIGVGWNFLFVGGTVLLTRSYRPAERFKSQAANDVVVFGVQAIASLTAGASLHGVGWAWSSLAMLPLLAVTFVALLRWRGHLDDARPTTVAVGTPG